MKCPLCGYATTRVIDSRAVKTDGRFWRRRRKCRGCGERFTTTEVPLSADELDEKFSLLDQITGRIARNQWPAVRNLIKAAFTLNDT